MSKDTALAKNSIVREVFQVGLYKRNQGRIARQVTFAVMAIVFLLAAYKLNKFVTPREFFVGAKYAIPAAVLAVGLWISYRVVNFPRFADFLIAVEAEMNKVSWPSRRELIRSSIVVIVVIFLMVIVLTTFDIFWRWLFQLIGVLR